MNKEWGLLEAPSLLRPEEVKGKGRHCLTCFCPGCHKLGAVPPGALRVTLSTSWFTEPSQGRVAQGHKWNQANLSTVHISAGAPRPHLKKEEPQGTSYWVENRIQWRPVRALEGNVTLRKHPPSHGTALEFMGSSRRRTPLAPGGCCL